MNPLVHYFEQMDPEKVREQLMQGVYLDTELVIEIIRSATHILKRESNLVHIEAPVNGKYQILLHYFFYAFKIAKLDAVCGDVHGQFFDLLLMLDMIGNPSSHNKLLFLGDYVGESLLTPLN